ncbi:hypothetical protein MMC30_002570 [Trapelia coarctata]|nr:hypothetical protein [Trapelia coarctata]
MTASCLASLAPTLPTSVTVTGFTAPHPSPTAIESRSDGILSAATCLRALLPLLPHHDAFLIACFSAHPLIDALREETEKPVIGIMEAALYASRMLGGRMGIVATGQRSVVMHKDAVRGYGLGPFFVGAEGTGLGVLELEGRERGEVEGAMGRAAERLVERGADCVCLGCAGMAGIKEACEEVVRARGAVVVEGVGVGVQFLVGLVREGLRAGKSGVYRSGAEGRAARGQDWV